MQGKNKVILATVLFALSGAAVGFTAIGAGDDDEVVKLAEVPAPAQKTIREHAGAGTIEKIERSTERGGTVYEVEGKGASGEFEFVVGEDGTYLGADEEDGDEGRAASGARAGEDDSEDVTVIDFSAAPQEVRQAFATRSGNAGATKVERIVDEGVTRYEIGYSLPDGTASMTFSDRGEVMEVESPVGVGSLPEAVRREVLRDYPGATITGADGVQLFYYELDVEVDGKTIEVGAFASGDIEDRLVGDEGSGDEDADQARRDRGDDEHAGQARRHRERDEDNDGDEDDD